MFASRMVFMFCLVAILAGCNAAATSYTIAQPDVPLITVNNVADLAANPGQLNGAIVRGQRLHNLHLENVTIRNTAFQYTLGENVTFRNVVFENCRFINAQFSNSRFENVTFKGGLITCANDANNIAERSVFRNTVFQNVIMDAISLDNPLFDLRDSSVVLANSYSIISKEPLFRGRNVQLTIDKSVVRFLTLTQLSGNSSLHLKDTIFENVRVGDSTFTSTSMSGCTTYGPALSLPLSPRR